jgi:hypothetical protein
VYRVCGIRFCKSFCNLGLDVPVHKGIRKEQERQHADEQYGSDSDARVQHNLNWCQFPPFILWIFIRHVLSHLAFFTTIAMRLFALKAYKGKYRLLQKSYQTH